MRYGCDICTNVMSSKSDGTFFDQNRVVTSPSYWEHIYTSYPQNLVDLENALGILMPKLCNDTSGFTVCSRCRAMIDNDTFKAQKYGIEKCVTSIPSGRVDSSLAVVVAGTVFKNEYGRWPSTIQLSDELAGLYSIKKEENSDCFVR